MILSSTEQEIIEYLVSKNFEQAFDPPLRYFSGGLFQQRPMVYLRKAGWVDENLYVGTYLVRREFRDEPDLPYRVYIGRRPLQYFDTVAQLDDILFGPSEEYIELFL